MNVTKKKCVECIRQEPKSDFCVPNSEFMKKCHEKYSELHNIYQLSPGHNTNTSRETIDIPKDKQVRNIDYHYVKKRTDIERPLPEIPPDVKELYRKYDIIDAPPNFKSTMDIIFRNRYRGVPILTLKQWIIYYVYMNYKYIIPDFYTFINATHFQTEIPCLNKIRRFLSTELGVDLQTDDRWDIFLNLKDVIAWLRNKELPSYKNSIFKPQPLQRKPENKIYILQFIFCTSSGGKHASFIIIDNRLKTKMKMALFDPNVGYTIDEKLDSTFSHFCKENKIEWLGLALDTETKLFQSIESACPKSTLDAEGYCQSWVYFVTECILKEQNYSDEFLTTILEPLNRNPELHRKFITDYLFSRLIALNSMIEPDDFDFEFYRIQLKKYFKDKIIPELKSPGSPIASRTRKRTKK